MSYAYIFFAAMWQTLCQMSPYLLFGFFVAGVLSEFISGQTVERHLGGSGVLPVIKAALLGVPLPLCSCGVIPVASSLRLHGASRASTTSFLLSTPQTGIDSIAVTFSLLGPVFAIFRPLAALVCGILGGSLVTIIAEKEEKQSSTEKNSSKNPKTMKKPALIRALRYGFSTLPRDIARSLLVGIAIAAAISMLIPNDYFSGGIGGGMGGMVLMMLFGIPLYVCATASVPVAAALMVKGISPGAALVFLMTGPATNAVAITTIWRIMGKRTTVIYLLTVAATSLGSGLALNAFFSIQGNFTNVSAHSMLPVSLQVVCALLLLAVLFTALWPIKSKSAQVTSSTENTTFSISGMTCSHCASNVERELVQCTGVESVTVDLATGNATVRGTEFDIDLLHQQVEKLGYRVSQQ